MIKVVKNRNPNLKGEEFIDDSFITILETVIDPNQTLDGGKEYLTEALNYINTAGECIDCGEYPYSCTCEKCEDCGFNRCMCNVTSKKKLYDYVYKIVIKYLNKNQKLKFLNELKRMNSLEINKNKLLEDVISKLQNNAQRSKNEHIQNRR